MENNMQGQIPLLRPNKYVNTFWSKLHTKVKTRVPQIILIPKLDQRRYYSANIHRAVTWLLQ